MRIPHGPRKGQLEWRRPHQATIRNILRKSEMRQRVRVRTQRGVGRAQRTGDTSSPSQTRRLESAPSRSVSRLHRVVALRTELGAIGAESIATENAARFARARRGSAAWCTAGDAASGCGSGAPATSRSRGTTARPPSPPTASPSAKAWQCVQSLASSNNISTTRPARVTLAVTCEVLGTNATAGSSWRPLRSGISATRRARV